MTFKLERMKRFQALEDDLMSVPLVWPKDCLPKGDPVVSEFRDKGTRIIEPLKGGSYYWYTPWYADAMNRRHG